MNTPEIPNHDSVAHAAAENRTPESYPAGRPSFSAALESLVQGGGDIELLKLGLSVINRVLVMRGICTDGELRMWLYAEIEARREEETK